MKTAITIGQNHDAHAQPGHAERPERLHAIQTLLEKDGILNSLQKVDTLSATPDDVELVHPASYLQKLNDASTAGTVWLDSDTYSTPESLSIALHALGGLLQLTKKVHNGDADNAFAVVRPPGHHARPSNAMGFCLFANIAIAAKWLQKYTAVKRILIVDFDVHHGNGTQEVFYGDPDVLYISTHQSPLYPGTGAQEEIGFLEGKNATVNVPLPAETDDDTLLYVFQHILRPRVAQFKPEFILLSAGYDAHWLDPIGGMNITIPGFCHIVKEILTWAKMYANDKLVALLEGGYHTDALAHGVLSTLRLLIDVTTSPSDPFGSKPGQPGIFNELKPYLEELTRFHVG